MFIIIYIVNIFLLLCGIGVSITTVNLTLFYYALFCKLVLLKIVITLVISAFTKEFHLNSFSLNVSTVIIIFILGGINFYHILPFVKVVLPAALSPTIPKIIGRLLMIAPMVE